MDIEQTGNLSLLSGNEINSDSDSKDNEYENLKKSEEIQNKTNLVNFVKDLENKLNKGENKDLSFDEIYEDYCGSKFITKSKIKNNIDNFCFKFGFLGVGILFGIFHLIGVYLIKSVLNALLNLIIESVKNYFYCKVKSKCSIINNDDEDMPIVFDFINYYYTFTMAESIDFNLMLVSGALGILLLNWKGFRISLILLCPFVFGPLFWLLNFEYSFKDEKIFDYGIFKILNLIFIYILIYTGIGALSLISQQILVESYLKYKKRNINKIDEQIRKITNEFSLNLPLDLDRSHSNKVFIITEKNRNKIFNDADDDDDDSLKNEKKNKEPRTISYHKHDNKKERLEEKKKKMKDNKFDYFFIICLMTIFSYLGKYLLNFGIDYILKKLFGEKYDKNKFFLSVIILYGILLIITVFIYSFYKYYYFEDINQKDKKKQIKKIRISKICGYIIYSEHRIKNSSSPKKCCQNCRLCCKLGCESIQNCCNETFCDVLKNFCCCCCLCCQKKVAFAKVVNMIGMIIKKKKKFFIIVLKKKVGAYG